MSVFEELLMLDRPFVEFKFKLGAKELPLKARTLSASETDSLEAFFADEYARNVMTKTTASEDKQSDLERVRSTYAMRPRHDILEQILGTRSMDIQNRGLEIAGIVAMDVARDRDAMTDEAELAAYDAELNARIKEAIIAAKEEITHDYDSKTDEELVDLISQVNVNVKAIGEARNAQRAHRLFFQVYNEDETRMFPSVADVSKLQPKTIEDILNAADYAFITAVPEDLPFVLPTAEEPSGLPPSPSPSAEVTPDGGAPTETTLPG